MTTHILVINDEDHYRDHKEHDWDVTVYTCRKSGYLAFMGFDRNADVQAYLCPYAAKSENWLYIQTHLSVKKIPIHPLCHH